LPVCAPLPSARPVAGRARTPRERPPRGETGNPVPLRAFLGLLALAAALSFLAGSYAAGSARVAALLVALKAHGLYAGPVDGYSGRGTRRAILRFQRHRHLAV